MPEVCPLEAEPVALVLPAPSLIANRSENDQRRLWRRYVLTGLAAASTGMNEADVDLVAGADRRRRLGGTDLFASVAHRAGWAAAVLGCEAVGIDLEAEDEAAKAAGVILAGVDHDIDLTVWHGLAGIWAAREAVLKAQGRDLTRDHRRWRFGAGSVRGDGGPAMRVDLVRRAGIVAAVAYAGA